MQADGNLVLYTASGHAVWDSQTARHPGARTVLQGTDGNLVTYTSNNAVLWSAYTNTHPGDRLCMQNDANLVVYSSSNAALWATMTNHAAKWGQTLSGSGKNPGDAGNCTYWAEYEFRSYTGWYINTLATAGTTGDAKYWAINASRRGWIVGSIPRMDSIVVWTGSANHVAWVTEVWPSQNKIRVSEMNHIRLGQVDSRVITPAFGVSGLQYIYVNPRP
jgi:surface antigen